jgi:hypothetical protein
LSLFVPLNSIPKKERHMTSTPDPARQLLRHAVATVAYRGGKALRGAPSTFATFRTNETTRTPISILAHLGDLFDWALSIAEGKQAWRNAQPGEWTAESDRFFAALTRFDQYLAGDQQLHASAEKLFQGPIADALTHVGQLNMLRRIAGSPVRGENYYVADIAAGRCGAAQSPPNREFD